MRLRRRHEIIGGFPTWQWDFARNGIPGGATFTRATTGSYFNSAGVLSSASSGVPRFDYDPVTLSPLGYLAEMASTNGIQRSRTFAAHWNPTRVTATDDAIVSPDGTQNATSMIEDTSNNSHFFELASGGMSVVNGSIYGHSIFVKNLSGARWIKLSLNGTGTTVVNFRPSDGTIGALGAKVNSVNARQLLDGWWRLEVKVDPDGTYTALPRVYLADVSSATFGSASYQGDGASGVALFGAQLETAGVGVTSYIATSGSTVTRNQDVLSLPLTSLPGWSASQGGTLVAAYRLHTLIGAGAGNNFVLGLRVDSSNLIGINAQYNNTKTRRSFVVSGGATQGDVGAGVASPALFTRTKQALGWGTSRVFFAYDGTAADGDSGALALPVAPTTLNIGDQSGHVLNGTLESIAYYRGARPDAFVQAVSR